MEPEHPRQLLWRSAGPGLYGPFVQTWEAKWLVDLSLRYAFTKRLSLAVGANNLFDTYPTEWDKDPQRRSRNWALRTAGKPARSA
jgi:outer membrane receptor protein involved in Fe transport